jgi:protein-S-isoprenylcysteine O-methyltransferase Ste14
MGFWKPFLRQTAKEYSSKKRLFVITCASIVFVFALPAGMFWIADHSDPKMHYNLFPLMSYICLFFSLVGISLSIWTVVLQHRRARGTPAPFFATKKLLVQRPYSYCRNPMALGIIIYYFGIAVFTRSYSAIFAVLLFTAGLLLIIRFLEEKELELRFGEEYRLYKKKTPFIIPRFGK